MDKSVCTFYQKIGACRHGEKCSRRHIRPTESRTVLVANLYSNPKVSTNDNETMSEKQTAEAFSHFYSDIFKRLAAEGEVDQIVVCENENFHLSGNVYVRFTTTQAAAQAVLSLNQEWYAGKPVYCELSPVSSFHEANCRAHDTNSCTRGDHCNFMHVIRPTNQLRTQLKQAQEKSIALAKIRAATGNAKWGEKWELPTKEPYVRESAEKNEVKPEVEASEKVETTEAVAAAEAADEQTEEQNEEQKEETKTDLVAKLFK